MKYILYLIAAALGVVGLIFIVGAQGVILRLVIGIILIAGAGGLIYLSNAQPQIIQQQSTVVHQVDLTGNVNLEQMSCKSCGAPLSKKSVSMQAGAVFINCEHCGATYQIEEEAKW